MHVSPLGDLTSSRLSSRFIGRRACSWPQTVAPASLRHRPCGPLDVTWAGEPSTKCPDSGPKMQMQNPASEVLTHSATRSQPSRLPQQRPGGGLGPCSLPGRGAGQGDGVRTLGSGTCSRLGKPAPGPRCVGAERTRASPESITAEDEDPEPSKARFQLCGSRGTNPRKLCLETGVVRKVKCHTSSACHGGHSSLHGVSVPRGGWAALQVNGEGAGLSRPGVPRRARQSFLPLPEVYVTLIYF